RVATAVTPLPEELHDDEQDDATNTKTATSIANLHAQRNERTMQPPRPRRANVLMAHDGALNAQRASVMTGLSRFAGALSVRTPGAHVTAVMWPAGSSSGWLLSGFRDADIERRAVRG